MKRYVLTGTPGAGKTALLRALEREGYAVVEEAATDVNALALSQGVAEPWRAAGFIGDIVDLQRRRQLRADGWPDPVVIFDRSPICTWALCRYLELEPPTVLLEEIARIGREKTYERRVVFVDNLGHCAQTDIRRISFEDSLRFEAVHREAYRRFGFDCIRIAAAPMAERLSAVVKLLGG
jgi:predicted ATPase